MMMQEEAEGAAALIDGELSDAGARETAQIVDGPQGTATVVVDAKIGDHPLRSTVTSVADAHAVVAEIRALSGLAQQRTDGAGTDDVKRKWTEGEIKAAFRHQFVGNHEAFEAAWATFRSNLP